MNCYDCKYMKIVYKNTLVGQAFCMKYTKFIPTSLMAGCWWCDNGSEGSLQLPNEEPD